MTISALPTAPSRDMTPSNFIVAADAFVAALPTFVAEANALQLDVNGKQITATNAATAAGVSATQAAQSAEAAASYTNFQGEWSNLTGGAIVPVTVYHNGEFWTLTSNLADITLAEPGVSSVWVKSSSIIYLPYTDRNNIRSSEARGATLIEGLGVFTFESASTATDNDATVFETAGGAWILRASLGGGQGSASSTESVVLTKDSVAVQVITPTKYGQSVTLPDATTLLPNTSVFTVKNNGYFPVAIKDSTAVIRGFLQPTQAVQVCLGDNSTAAGGWILPNTSLLGVTSDTLISTGSETFTSVSVVDMDAERVCLVYVGINNYAYAIVFNKVTQTTGLPTVVRAAATQVIAIKSANDQVLVVTCPSNSTAMQVVTLTITDISVFVNTPVPVTLDTSLGNLSPTDDARSGDMGGHLLAVDSTFVLSYTRITANGCCRAITVSGTTPTVGSDLTNGSSYPARIFYSSAGVFLSVISTGSVNLVIMPTSVAGTTLTNGTSCTVNCPASSYQHKFGKMGSYWLAVTQVTSNIYAGIISVVGTTATSSVVTVGSFSGSIITTLDVRVISESLALVVGFSNTAVLRSVINTSGAASLGTAKVVWYPAETITGVVFLPQTSTNVVGVCCSSTPNLSIIEVDISTPSTLQIVRETTQSTYSGFSLRPCLLNFNFNGMISGKFLAQPLAHSQNQNTVWFCDKGFKTTQEFVPNFTLLINPPAPTLSYFKSSAGFPLSFKIVEVAQP